MRRVIGLSLVRRFLVSGLAVLIVACAPGGAPTPPVVEPSTSASATPSDPASAIIPTTSPRQELRIAVLASDSTPRNEPFDTEAYDGAVRGASAVGAAQPTVVRATSDADAALLMQALVDQGFDTMVVSVGLEAVAATAARANPGVWFIGVDHDPCTDAAGNVDPTYTDCSGDIATLLPNYIAIHYAEDQAGYLAGMVAALTDADIIGAVGGVSLCGPCIRYIQGYELGAKSIDPTITVQVAWVSDGDFGLGFDDQRAGKAFGQRFITETAGLDVLFQVAGTTGLGVIDAACDAGIGAIGVDVDQHESYPASRACIITSAEKRLSESVAQSIVAIEAGAAVAGRITFDARNDGIGVSPFYDASTMVAADAVAQLDAAIAAMKAGTLTTCPADACGSQDALPLGD